jgi:alcohol dehydrogenase class IV
MTHFDFHPRTRVIFGPGTISQLGERASELAFRRTLLVADEGMVGAGYVATATRLLERQSIAVFQFHDFGTNPDSDMVLKGQRFAEGTKFDSIVALGGGSSMDMAKAINIVCHNPGAIQDFKGYGKGSGKQAPMIGIPTTAGTGSEAQTHAIIADSRTHLKMAIGDPQSAFRVAILDPELTLSQPPYITATAGYDAISHAVETFVTSKRNAISDCFARESWQILSANFERVLTTPDDIEVRGAMLLGANLAGAAIENSMLGAAHACANPLSANYDIAHGAAIAMTLPQVVRWNGDRYRELFKGDLSERLAELAQAAGLPVRLSECGVKKEDFPELAKAAAGQWTGRFNPRPFDYEGALEIYEWAY